MCIHVPIRGGEADVATGYAAESADTATMCAGEGLPNIGGWGVRQTGKSKSSPACVILSLGLWSFNSAPGRARVPFLSLYVSSC